MRGYFSTFDPGHAEISSYSPSLCAELLAANLHVGGSQPGGHIVGRGGQSLASRADAGKKKVHVYVFFFALLFTALGNLFWRSLRREFNHVAVPL